MAKRYSIMATEYGSEREVEYLQVDSNPQAVADGLAAKRVRIDLGKTRAGKSRPSSVPKYRVRIVDNLTGEPAAAKP